jgi:PsbN protein
METATVLIIFIASLLFGVTGYSMYSAFGPGSKNLRDPFEDHGAIRFGSFWRIITRLYFISILKLQPSTDVNSTIWGEIAVLL